MAHVVVALCDNESQGIVPVPDHLGNGQDPDSNLYWGARYGVRSYFVRDAGWEMVSDQSPPPEGVLERVVLRRYIVRPGPVEATAYVVADAYDGRKIEAAIDRSLHMAGGHHTEVLAVEAGDRRIDLASGGRAHVIAYVGHNGAMDFSIPEQPPPSATAAPGSAIMLACSSKAYFESTLKRTGAHALLLTTGLMAPEAYTLDALLRKWFSGAGSRESLKAAAAAYNQFQGCGPVAAARLFWGAP